MMEKEIKKIEGRKFSLANSYFKNRKDDYPDTLLEIVQYWAKYKELPFDHNEENWLYDTTIIRQKKYGIHHDQFITPDPIAIQLVELTNNFIPTGNNVLNACCGIGQLTKYLLESRLNVFGFDKDEEMVDVCKLVYPDAITFQYDFCREIHLLEKLTQIPAWDLIVSNPPNSKVVITSYLNWLSQALSNNGKAILLMQNDFEYKTYSKHYKNYVERFKVLCKEEITSVEVEPKYKGMRIYIMELSEEYKKERAENSVQKQYLIKENPEDKKQKKFQIMERKDLKKIQNVRLDKIVLNPLNPRKKIVESEIKELAQGIKEVGLIHPITLRKKDNKLEIVAGECRYRAFCLNKEETIPAIIGEYTDDEVMLLALAENSNRNNLSALEEANGYLYLIKNNNYTIDDIIIKSGKNESYIRNRMRLLLLIPDFQYMLENEELSLGTLIELSKYSKAIQQEVYDNYFKENNNFSWHNLSKKELAARLIKLYTMALDDYQFNKDECKTCQNNTDTNTLFDECKGKCTNLECLRSKQHQYTLDICKVRVDQDNFEVIVSPTDRLNPEVAEKLKEEGIEVKTTVTYELPELPQKPKLEDFKLKCDYNDAMEKYKLEDLEYAAEMDEYEKKVNNGEYKRCLHIGGNNPIICYAPIKNEGKKTLTELEQQAKANYETTKNNIVKASVELIKTKEIAATQFTMLEEEIFLFLLLGYVDKKHFSLLGIADTNKEYLTDKDKENIISRITTQQYGFLKREFILKYLPSFSYNKKSPKLQIYLQSFAQQHFPEDAGKIVKKQLDIYNKSKEKIDKEIESLGLKPKMPVK